MKIGRKEVQAPVAQGTATAVVVVDVQRVDVSQLSEDARAEVLAQVKAHRDMRRSKEARDARRGRPVPMDTEMTLAPGGDTPTDDVADHRYDARHPRTGEFEIVVVDGDGRKHNTSEVTR